MLQALPMCPGERNNCLNFSISDLSRFFFPFLNMQQLISISAGLFSFFFLIKLVNVMMYLYQGIKINIIKTILCKLWIMYSIIAYTTSPLKKKNKKKAGLSYKYKLFFNICYRVSMRYNIIISM